jgi:hypothetical protein
MVVTLFNVDNKQIRKVETQESWKERSIAGTD